MMPAELERARLAEAAAPARQPEARELAERLAQFAAMAVEGQVEIREITHLERGLEHSPSARKKRQTLIITFVER